MTTPTIDQQNGLIDCKAAAALCGICRRQWMSLHAQGRVPAPHRLGKRCLRWSPIEIGAWLSAGTPPREKWNAMRKAAVRDYLRNEHPHFVGLGA